MTDYEGLIRQALKGEGERLCALFQFLCGGRASCRRREGRKAADLHRLQHRERGLFPHLAARSGPLFFKAVSEGCRTFQAIAIVGGGQGAPASYTMPCGVV